MSTSAGPAAAPGERSSRRDPRLLGSLHRRRLPSRLVPVVAGLVATLVTLIGAGVPSWWNDEAATLRLARLPVAQMLEFTQQKDAVHLVHALLVHAWIGVAGDSELAVRSLSAVAVGVAAAGVVVLVRDLGRPRAALLAATVFVLLPRVSSIGVEARSSALAVALVVGAAVWSVRAGRDGRWWRWALLGLLTGAAIAVFAYAALVVPALVLLALGARRRAHGAGVGRTLAGLAAALAGAVLVASPVVLEAAGQSAQIGWLRTQPVTAWTVLVEPAFDQAWWVALLVVGVVVAGLVTRSRERRRPGRVAGTAEESRRASLTTVALATWLVGPALVLLLATAVVGPTYTPRYLAVSMPALAVVVALAAARWRRPVVVAVVVALVLAALPVVVAQRGPVAKPAGVDLRGVAQLLQEEARPGDAVLLSDEGTVSRRPRIALAAYPEAFAALDDVAFERSWVETGTYSDVLVGGDELVARLRGVDRVWVALPEAGDDDLVETVREAGLAPGEEQRVAGVSVTLWQR